MNSRLSTSNNGHSSRESSPRVISSHDSGDRSDTMSRRKNNDSSTVLSECKRREGLSDNSSENNAKLENENESENEPVKSHIKQIFLSQELRDSQDAVVEPKVSSGTSSITVDTVSKDFYKLDKQVFETSSKNIRSEDYQKERKAQTDVTNSTTLNDKIRGVKVDDSDTVSKIEESVSVDITNPNSHGKEGINEECNYQKITDDSFTKEAKKAIGGSLQQHCKDTAEDRDQPSPANCTTRTCIEKVNKDSKNDQSGTEVKSVSVAASVSRLSKFSQIKEHIKKRRANVNLEVKKPSSLLLNTFVPFQENVSDFKGSVIQMLHGNESSKAEPCEPPEIFVDNADGTLACGEKKQIDKLLCSFKTTSKSNNNTTDPNLENYSLSHKKSSITEPCVIPEKSAQNFNVTSKVAFNVKKDTTEGSFVSKIPVVNDKSADSNYGCAPRGANISLTVKPIAPPMMETIPLLIPPLKNKEKKQLVKLSEEPRNKDTSQPKTHFPNPPMLLGNVQKMSQDLKSFAVETPPQKYSTSYSSGDTNSTKEDTCNIIKETDFSSSRFISETSSVLSSLLCTRDLQTPGNNLIQSSNVNNSALKSLEKGIALQRAAKFNEVSNLQVTHLPSIGSYDDFSYLPPFNKEQVYKSNVVITDTSSVTKYLYPEKESVSSNFDKMCIGNSAMQVPAICSNDGLVNDVSSQFVTSNEVSAFEKDTRQGIFPAERNINPSEPSSEKTRLSDLGSKDTSVDAFFESTTRPKLAGDEYDWTAVRSAVSSLSDIGLNQVAVAGKGIDTYIQSTTKGLYLRRRDLDSIISATVESPNSEFSSQATLPRGSTSPKVANNQIKEASTAVEAAIEKEFYKNLSSRIKSHDENPSESASTKEIARNQEVEKSKTVKSTIERKELPEESPGNEKSCKTTKTESLDSSAFKSRKRNLALVQSSGESGFSRENTARRSNERVDIIKANKSTNGKAMVKKVENKRLLRQLKTQENNLSESDVYVGNTVRRKNIVESKEIEKLKTAESAFEKEVTEKNKNLELAYDAEISNKIPTAGSLEPESLVSSEVAFNSNDKLLLPESLYRSDLQRENTTCRLEDDESEVADKSTTAKYTVENEVVKFSEITPKECSATSDLTPDQESFSASELVPFQCLSKALRQKEGESVMEPSYDVLNEKTDEKQKLIKKRLYENAGFKVTKNLTPIPSYPPMPKTRIAHVPKVPMPSEKKCSAPSTLHQKSMISTEKQLFGNKGNKFCPKENAIPLALGNIKKERPLKPKHRVMKAVGKKTVYHSSLPSSAKVTEDDSMIEEKVQLVPTKLLLLDRRDNDESVTPQSKDNNGKFVESPSSPREVFNSRLNAYKCANKNKTQHGLSRNLETSNEDSHVKKVLKPKHSKLELADVQKTNLKVASIIESTSSFEDTIAAPKPEIFSKKTGSKVTDKFELGQIDKKVTHKAHASPVCVSTSECPYVKQEILCKKSESKSSEEERTNKHQERVLKETKKPKSIPNTNIQSKLSTESSSEDSDEIFFQYNRKSLVPVQKKKDAKKGVESRKRRREKTSETPDEADRKIKSETSSNDSTCDSTLSKAYSELSRRESLNSGGGASGLKGPSAKSQIKYHPQAWNDPFCRKCQSLEFELLLTSIRDKKYYLKCRSCEIHIVVDMSNEDVY